MKREWDILIDNSGVSGPRRKPKEKKKERKIISKIKITLLNSCDAWPHGKAFLFNYSKFFAHARP